ncbi:PR-1-like protein [Scheffersomyces xylosifermentans]|uniref:PR-1-like protein n=1 Tax=Scheffersomyces xylosifermentans TaxID=1304137 RepID=UPI00315D2CFB
MKFLTLTTALSILAAASAAVDTVIVTQVHVVTVVGGQAQPHPPPPPPPANVKIVTVTAGAPVDTPVAAPAPVTTVTPPVAAPKPTTLVTKAAPAPAPAQTTAAQAGVNFGDADSSFAQPLLNIHNQKRAQHGAGSLSWSNELFEYAQAYANKYDCSGNLVHSGGPFGENLAVGYEDGVSAFGAWYEEGDNYDYSNANVLDHFTQIIWKGTTEVGCAYKDCSAQNWGKYIICSYNPPGNYVGEGKANLSS